MKTWKISICIAIYNVPNKYFDECLESIIFQSYKNFEIIIVDDQTTEYEYSQQLKALDDNHIQYRYIKNEVNQGFAKVKDISREYITGDIIFDVDADDALLPDALSVIKDYFNKYEDIDFCFFSKASVFHDSCLFSSEWDMHFDWFLDFYYDIIKFQTDASFKEMLKRMDFCLIDKEKQDDGQNKLSDFLLFFMANSLTPWLRIFSREKYKYKFHCHDYAPLKNWEINVPFISALTAKKILFVKTPPRYINIALNQNHLLLGQSYNQK